MQLTGKLILFQAVLNVLLPVTLTPCVLIMLFGHRGRK